jgi:predicted ATPase/DNA-binding NarL/FixJ family response regulator
VQDRKRLRLTSRPPLPISRLVGRRRELTEVARRLATTRLLTLTGPGGIGKTRIALEVGRAIANEYGDGVGLVDLAPLSDVALIAQTVASALGVREHSERRLLDVVVDALRSRQILLILDNCEHLVTGCADLAGAVLAECEGLRILATSREPLGVLGEVLWPVPGLSLPDAHGPPSADSVRQSEAVQLFIERAEAGQPEFHFDDRNAATVADICRRLDGLPLAIELAAARTRVLSVEDIAARLNDRFRLLTTGSRSAPARQQTLEAAIQWSYDLLSSPEQRLLERLSVFAGGWTLDAAEAVGIDGAIQSRDVLDLLGRLVDKSLVVSAQAVDGTLRYSLLETVRQYGHERLVQRGELEVVADRHARWFVALAERADTELLGPGEGEALAHLEAEHDNLRAALRWLLGRRDATSAQRLGGAMGLFWFFRSFLSEGRGWLNEVLSMADGNASTPQRARCVFAAADLAMAQGDYVTSRHQSAESLALWRELGNDKQAAAAMYMVGQLTRILGDYEAAEVVLRDAAELGQNSGNIYYAALSLIGFADMNITQGDLPNAMRRAEAARSLALETGRPRLIVHTLRSLADVHFELGDLHTAAALAHEAVARARNEVLSPWWLVQGLLSAAKVASAQGHFERAYSMLSEALALSREIGNTAGIAAGLEGFAYLLSARGRVRQAVVVAAVAAATRQHLGGGLLPTSARLQRQLEANVRGALTPEVRRRAWREGQALEIEAAIHYALSSFQTTSRGTVRPVDVLTPREREVASLVAQGLSNRAVAERLVLSEKTAANHLARIFEKLGVESRTQLAVRAKDLGLATEGLGSEIG